MNAFGKLIEDKHLSSEIKIKFQEYLEKLNNHETKQIGFRELKLLINKYSSYEYVQIYLPYLLNIKNNLSVTCKEFQIILIGYVIAICGYENIGGYKTLTMIIDSLSIFLKVNFFHLNLRIHHRIFINHVHMLLSKYLIFF